MHRNIAVCLVGFAILASCSEGEPPQPPAPDRDFHVITRPLEFKHRFASVPLVNGQIPVVEAKNSPQGRRYSMQDRAGAEAANGVSDSVLAELETRRIPAAELAARREAKYGGLRIRKPKRAKVSTGVRTELAQVGIVSVAVRFHEPDRIQVRRELNRAVALGQIQDWRQYQAEKDRLKALDRAEIAARLEPIEAAATLAGLEVLYRCEAMYCMDVRIDEAGLAYLESLPTVAYVDLNHENEINQQADGVHVIQGLQFEQFLPENGGSTTAKGQGVHDGENFPAEKDYVDLRMALIDVGFPEVDHPGFKEGTGSSDRVEFHYDCTLSTCTNNANPAESLETSHATQMLGTAIGDLRDEQEGPPDVPDGLGPEQQRSGYAGEGKAWVYRAGTSTTFSRRAMDHIVAASGNAPVLVHMPIGSPTGDADCSGDHASDQDANDLFEDGKTFVFGSGNNGQSGTDCTVEMPGSAISALTVGLTGANADDSTADVRTALVHPISDWGGNLSEGDGRTIIDLVPFGCRRFLFDTTWGYTNAFCSTSQSSAAMAGGLLAYIDWYINVPNWTDIREEPGFVQANALLMGDRRYGNNSFLTAGFHRRYGAGAVEMRRFDSKGMDGPWGFGSGDVCVDDGEEVVIDINNGNTLSSSVDDFKAVAWWYDKRHENGTTIDDIDLVIQTSGFAVNSDDNYDDKERVYHHDIGGNIVHLEIHGIDVTAANVGPCGSNSMLVYYAYFYEDDARNDGDGPTAAEIEREGDF